MSQDFQSRLQRIFRFDELQLGLAARKKSCEEGAEDLVDASESLEQALPALFVEALYAAPELCYGLKEIVLLLHQAIELLLHALCLVFGPQVDAAEPLPVFAEADGLSLDVLLRGKRRNFDACQGRDLLRPASQSFADP